MNNSMNEVKEVLKFWFEELEPAQWWGKDDGLDRQISERFGDLHRRAVQAELHGWHKDIIERFGRYPHRNAILGRESTPEEVAFLKQPGSSF
jgi:uncharacterized protein (DUF924 family)